MLISGIKNVLPISVVGLSIQELLKEEKNV